MAPKTAIPPTKPVAAGTPKPTAAGTPKPATAVPQSQSRLVLQSQLQPSKSIPLHPKPESARVPPGSGQGQKKRTGSGSPNGSGSHAGSPKRGTGSSPSRKTTPSPGKNNGKPPCDNRSRKQEKIDQRASSSADSNTSIVKISVFINWGSPKDFYFNRHVKAHFTSPQAPDMHETVHAQQISSGGLWHVVRETQRTDSDLRSSRWVKTVMAPIWVTVKKGQERVPADILASVNVANREADWNCQKFLLEGFEKLVESGYKTPEWYDEFFDEFFDELMDDAEDE